MSSPSRCFLFFVLLIPCLGVATGLEVLFIGNSHTGQYDLPGKVAGLAAAGGHDLYVDVSTVGSSTLSYHTHHEPTLSKINERSWDYVILQEHSYLTVIDYWRDASFYPKASLLDSMISAAGAQTAFFMHHARQRPDDPYCIQDSCSRDFQDYADMQAMMAASYLGISNQLDAPLVPVGQVWAAALLEEPELPLWSSDSLHASLQGAYFSACVFYTVLFGESPVGLNDSGGLPEAEAQAYQQKCQQIMEIESLSLSTTPDQELILEWNPVPGRSFQVFSSQLPYGSFPSSWTLQTVLPDSLHEVLFPVDSEQRFYRVVVAY